MRDFGCTETVPATKIPLWTPGSEGLGKDHVEDFLETFGAFWGSETDPKWSPKTYFWALFFQSVFACHFLLIFGRSETEKCCSRLGETVFFTKYMLLATVENWCIFGDDLEVKIDQK